eukprot:1159757-Pelagomonas_calceolata.AAC.5
MELGDAPLPGTALAEELDKQLLVQLRDGRKILGAPRCEIRLMHVQEGGHGPCLDTHSLLVKQSRAFNCTACSDPGKELHTFMACFTHKILQ